MTKVLKKYKNINIDADDFIFDYGNGIYILVKADVKTKTTQDIRGSYGGYDFEHIENTEVIDVEFEEAYFQTNANASEFRATRDQIKFFENEIFQYACQN